MSKRRPDRASRPHKPAGSDTREAGPIARAVAERRERAARAAAWQKEYRERLAGPMAALRPEWDAAVSELWDTLSPVWWPWNLESRRPDDPAADPEAIAKALVRLGRLILRRDEILASWREWSGWNLPDADGRPESLVGRLELAASADLRHEFDNPGLWALPSLLVTATQGGPAAVAQEVRAVLADDHQRVALGWVLCVADCLWPCDALEKPRDPVTPAPWPDPSPAWTIRDDQRVRCLLAGNLRPSSAGLFRDWPRADPRRDTHRTTDPGCHSSASGAVRKPDVSHLAAKDIARHIGKNSGTVEVFLSRLAGKLEGCRVPVPNPQKGRAQYLYCVDEVWPCVLANMAGWPDASESGP